MPGPAFIAGDWGSTQLRLRLCSDDGTVIDSASGPGAVAARGRHQAVIESQLAAWGNRAAGLPIVLSGMVGSSIGWLETHYVSCPCRPEAVAESAVPVWDGRVHLVPGLECRNPFGAPDVMRGEETQLLGALQLAPQLSRGPHLLCLPGTHTKWATLAEGVVEEFLTAPVGELFELISRHSALLGGAGDAPFHEPSFRSALAEVRRHGNAESLHRLFECRSRSLRGELAAGQAGSFLSGLLIGSDVAAALRLFEAFPPDADVQVVGAPALAARYAAAIAGWGRGARTQDGDAAALAGLAFVYRRLAGRGSLRAAG